MYISNFKKLATAAICTVVIASSCNKKDPEVIVDPSPAEMGFEFKNYVGSDALALNTGVYTNSSNELFSVTKFNYYISNVKLIKSDGSTYNEPDSYHLIKSDVASSGHFHMENVPAGMYKGVTFLVGVDSARNTSGAQTGALDQSNDMFWTWQTGYIMAKLEGKLNPSSPDEKTFKYHIGGFSGDNSGIRTVTLELSSPMDLKAGGTGELEITSDLKKWFEPNNISIAATPEIMNVGTTSRKIADNYAKMFKITAYSVVNVQ